MNANIKVEHSTVLPNTAQHTSEATHVRIRVARSSTKMEKRDKTLHSKTSRSMAKSRLHRLVPQHDLSPLHSLVQCRQQQHRHLYQFLHWSQALQLWRAKIAEKVHQVDRTVWMVLRSPHRVLGQMLLWPERGELVKLHLLLQQVHS